VCDALALYLWFRSVNWCLLSSGPYGLGKTLFLQYYCSVVYLHTESLMCAVGICEKAKLIDVTRKQGTTESLTETRLPCTLRDKDLYLYYVVCFV